MAISTANLQHSHSKSVMSPVNLQHVYNILPPTDLSATSWRVEISRYYRPIRCVASNCDRHSSERTNLQQVHSIYNDRLIRSVLTAVTWSVMPQLVYCATYWRCFGKWPYLFVLSADINYCQLLYVGLQRLKCSRLHSNLTTKLVARLYDTVLV